jgi:hypothetical protein
MPDNTATPGTWGSRKMDEFIAWISQPGKPTTKAASVVKPVDPARAREHIDNILEYIDQIERLARLGNRDAVDLLAGLSPMRPLLKAARTGAEIAEAAQASEGYLRAHIQRLYAREEAKSGVRSGDKSWEADDQRFIAYATVDRQYQNLSRRVISYNNPDGTSIPQLMACKVERDFIHKLKFWEKTQDSRYAPCDSVRYLLELSRP